MAKADPPITRYYDDESTSCKEQNTCDNDEDKQTECPNGQPTNVTTISSQAEGTKTLLRATPSTPAITFTRYDSGNELFRPSASSIISQVSSTQLEFREATTMVMHVELESYFNDLRQEFEVKTGRVWAPLEPFKDDDWDWEEELVFDGEEDVEHGFDDDDGGDIEIVDEETVGGDRVVGEGVAFGLDSRNFIFDEFE